MARPSYAQPRDPAEYAGAVWRPTPVVCPKCLGDCEALRTKTTGKIRAIQCTVCQWYQASVVQKRERSR